MGRRSVDVRREEILAATVEEMGRRGMDQTRVRDVADRIGVSTGLVFYHFDTRDKLLAAALEHAVDLDLARLRRALRRTGTSVERLQRVLRSYGPKGSAAGWRLWIDAWSHALRNPATRAMLRTLDDRWRETLVEVIADGVEAGQLRCADPRTSVARIGAMLDGLTVAVLVYSTVTRQQLRAWMWEAVAHEAGLAPGHLTPAS